MPVLYVSMSADVPNIMSLDKAYMFKKTAPRQSWRNLLDTASKFSLFLVSGFKDEKLTKKQRTWKLKHANSILESFEYFCQMSSKLNDPYSLELYRFKVGVFFRDTV